MMTSPAAPRPSRRFVTIASWVADIVAYAHTWPFDEPAASRYDAVLDAIEAAASSRDEAAMTAAYHALVDIGDRNTRYGSRARPKAASERPFPHERTNELVHRLRSICPDPDDRSEEYRREGEQRADID
jgi:class 3 adenylate cyclase